MKIYDKNNNELYDIQVDDNSVRYRSIMTDDSLTLNFSLTGPISIPQFSYVTFEGSRYTLWRPSEFKKHGTRNHEYTLTLHGYREFLKFVKYKDMGAKPYRLKFPLTAKPAVFLQNLVACLNANDPAGGWAVGSCIDAPEKTLSFNHEYCIDALGRFAQEWETEYEFEGKTIHFRKVEKFKDAPLALSYGKGNGFLPGVGRYNEGDKQPVGKLFVQGGERNIDFSTYNSKSLLLPKSRTLVHDGKLYRTDADGMYITRDGNSNTAEDSYDASHIYPRRIGTVSSVIVVDAEKHFYDVIDASIESNLNYRDCRIAGEKAIIKFESGALVGREFDLEQTDTDLTGYIHAERRFKIVPQELDGQIMPGGVFIPAVGDKYAVFNISMPAAYISDNATKTGASWDMFREAVRYFAENEVDRFRFTGELDGIWSKSRWLEIGAKITPGGHVLFSDEQFQPTGVVIRIVAVKDYVNKPHKPEITLSNAPVPGSFSSGLAKLEADEVVIEESKKEVIRYSKRRWRDARETMSMLEKSLLDFSGSINPITVQTMQLVAGDESLQFRFVNSKTNPQPVSHNFVFNPQNKQLTTAAGIIQHMTLGITTLSTASAPRTYKFWDMAAYTSPALVPEKAYYLYAKCAKTGTTGTFILSETAIGMESEAGFYHLLVGILNSEGTGGDRSFAPLYGFSEILPGRMTTDRIVSTDGKTYFDLVNGIIGGRIRFLNSQGDEQDLTEGLDGHSPYIDAATGTWWQWDDDAGEYADTHIAAEGRDGAPGAQGQAGEPARFVEFSPMKSVISVAADGSMSPGSVTVSVMAHNTSVSYFLYYIDNGSYMTSPPAGVTRNGNNHTINVSQVNFIDRLKIVAYPVSGTPQGYECIKVRDGRPGADGADGADGYTPVKGVDYFDGVPGQNGADGSSSYMHIRYSQNANGSPMTTNPAGAIYIGIAATQSATPPTSYSSYNWSLIKGSDGVAGESGADGQTSYLHIKYSNDGGSTFTSGNGETAGAWIGIYVDFTQADSNNPADYTWNKVKGDKGDTGDQGPKGDGVLIRYKRSAGKPAKPADTDLNPAGWLTVPDKPDNVDIYDLAFDGDWALQSNGEWKSKTITHNGKTAVRVNFTTHQDDTIIKITARVSSEVNYDKLHISKLDTEFGDNYVNELKNISGTKTEVLSYTIAAKGEHFVDFEYTKDGSTSTGDDAAYISIVLPVKTIWVTTCAVVNGVGSGWSDPRIYLDERVEDLVAKTYKSAAITDKFATDINGALIQTVMILLRELNSQTETAGTSGIQGDGSLPALWAGGTYAQAIASLAKIILRHDGSGQLAGGNILWGADGNASFKGTIEATAGKFYGRVQQPFILDYDIDESFSIIAGGLLASVLYLPADGALGGSVVRIYCHNRNTLEVRVDGGHAFLQGAETQITISRDRYREFLCVGYAGNFIGWLPLPSSDDNGLLLSATVGIAGLFSNSWGTKKHATQTAIKNSTGRYTVYHSVGHTDYQVTATAHASNRSCHIVSKYSSSFVIEWRSIGSSPSLTDTAFDFQITGKSY